MKNNVQNKWVQAIFYILVFFLLREWLLPVLELTNTNYLSIFIAFIVLCLVFSFFSVPWWLSGPGKLFYIAWVLVVIYTNEVFFTGEAISFLYNDLMTNTSALITRDWTAVTNSFRTVLFFSLLWMTAYLIHHWISVRMNIFLFFFMTVVFIAALDTFSPYEGDGAILRVMILGLLLSGLLKVAKILKQNHLSVTSEKYGSLVVPLIIIVAFSGVIGYILPKANPIWNDPVPFLQSFAEGAGSGPGGVGGIRKIGYGEDDSVLGGGFQSDSTVVFEAVVKTGQYWKIETKDTYTSKGWEQSVDSSNEILTYNEGDTIDTGFTTGPAEDQDVAQYTFELQYPFLMYPYGSVTADAQDGTSFSVSTNTQKIETYQENDTVALKEYSISFSEPTYSLTALRGTSAESLTELGTEFDRYLQLPEALPERVSGLALSITEEESNLFDKARAIERYFARNGFVYDQQNISIPEADQDYVDQFLFDTKRGYCDNFSTSMVVMLRSLDIPARWVKGFAEGEQMVNDNGDRIYQVTNNNAHSWVEAYLPGIGWMPFEPTIGFSRAGNIEFDIESGATEPPEEQVAPPKPDKPATPDAADDNKSISERFTEIMKNSMDWISDNRGRIILWSIIAIAIGIILYRIRQKWMPKLLVPYYRLRKDDWNSFESSYHRLLKQLSLYGVSRNEGQTLQSYANYVDGFFGTRDMKTLTTAYEKGFYGSEIESHEWLKLRESWENLINRTSG
jgi:transglutaminase-like putative cysteine protease